MDVSIRQLKASLAGFIHKVAANDCHAALARGKQVELRLAA